MEIEFIPKEAEWSNIGRMKGEKTERWKKNYRSYARVQNFFFLGGVEAYTRTQTDFEPSSMVSTPETLSTNLVGISHRKLLWLRFTSMWQMVFYKKK